MLEAVYLPSGEIAIFEVNFTQYGEQQMDRWINGKFRYESSVSAVPVPAAIWFFATGLILLARLRGDSSSARNTLQG